MNKNYLFVIPHHSSSSVPLEALPSRLHAVWGPSLPQRRISTTQQGDFCFAATEGAFHTPRCFLSGEALPCHHGSRQKSQRDRISQVLSPLSTLFCVNVLSQRQTITLCPLEVTKVWTYLGLWFMNNFSWHVGAWTQTPTGKSVKRLKITWTPFSLLNYFSLDFRANDVSHNSSKQCPPSPRRQVLGNQKDKGVYQWFTQVFLHCPHLEWLNSDRCNIQNNGFEINSNYWNWNEEK